MRASRTSAGATWAAGLRRDPLHALRLTLLLALLLVSAASLGQFAALHRPPSVVLLGGVVLAGVAALRVVEYRVGAPVPVLVDLAELVALTGLLLAVRNIDSLLGTLFFLLLCRSGVGRLGRLIQVIIGYMAVWIGCGILDSEIHVYAGAMISMPVVGGLVYALRRLMLRLHELHEQQNELLSGVLQRLPFPVVVTDRDGGLLLTNPAATELTGWSAEAPAGPDGLAVRDTDGAPVDLLGAAAAAAGEESGLSGLELRLTRPDASTAHVVVDAVPVDFGGYRVAVLGLLDVTAQRLYEEHLEFAAYHDTLTGLPNRALLWQRLAVAERSGEPYAVLLIDLDGFKAVNDTLGHQAGDELLRHVSDRLREVTGGDATVVARLGGDEFAVLLDGARDPEAVAAAVRDSFARPFDLSGGPIDAGGSVGYAVGAPGQPADETVAAADGAMYRCKPRARGGTAPLPGPRYGAR
jgi:diguanylate cyclase (GGDEF)-like protein/PAS domain S-box-containing protein